MMKMSIGFVIGFITASIIWYFMQANEIFYEQNPGSQSIQDTDLTKKASTHAPTPPPKTSTLANIIAPNNDTLTQKQSLSTSPDSVTDELTPTPSTPSDPVLTSHEHDELLNRTNTRKSVPQLHKELELEEYDQNWSPQTESLISQYLSEHDLAEKFSINHVICRTTMCEIQVFGYEGHEHWNQIMRDIRGNDWFDQFGSVSTTSSSKDGQATALTIVQLKSSDELNTIQ